MKKIVIILLTLLFVLACKTKETAGEKKGSSPPFLPKKQLTSKDLIPIFTITHDSLYSNQKDQISSFNNKIEDICVNVPKKTDSEDFSDLIHWHKVKTFQKVLARDFGNENFKQIKKLYLSFVKVKMGNTLSSEIDIQEWVFKNKKTAKSCFESFDGKARNIHFKVTNWIWFLKGNTIFLLYSFDEPVDKKPMQILKKRLKGFLEIKESQVKEYY